MINHKYPWPSHLRLRKVKRGKRELYEIDYAGRTFTSLVKLATFLGVSKNYVYNTFIGRNIKESQEYLKKAAIHARYGVPIIEKIYVKRKDCVQFLSALRSEFPNISDNHLRIRLGKWEKGQIDCDDLYKPVKLYNADNRTTFNKPRSEEDRRRLASIKDIPGPTDIEKKLWNL